MKKGKARIVIGIILIVLQVMSIAGNAKVGRGVEISFDSVYDLVYSIGYMLAGIIGVVLLILGIRAYVKSK